MQNLNISLIDTAKFDELLAKVNSVYELLRADKIQPEKLYTNSEACQYLNVCSKTLQNYRDTGQLVFIQTGRKIYYTQNKLNDFFDKNKKEIFTKTIKPF